MDFIWCVLYIVSCTDLSESTAQVQFPGFSHAHRHNHHHKFFPSNNNEGFQSNGQRSPIPQTRNALRAALKAMHPEFHDINFPPNSSISTQKFHEFYYEGQLGPGFWPSMFESCAGQSQSPIAIDQNNTKNVQYEQFIFKDYESTPAFATITNNGHTVMVTLPKGATIQGGGLPGEFELLNFHFHWGSDSTKGSEHILEGIHYPLELHIVHWNSNYFSSDEAMHHGDGITVLSVLFHVEPLDNPFMESIIQELGNVVKSGTSKTFIPSFELRNLLPTDTNRYYRYSGSLTTPDCSESVIWTIFAKTLPISERQLNEFRKLLDSDDKDKENNYRPVQPMNSRTVLAANLQ